MTAPEGISDDMADAGIVEVSINEVIGDLERDIREEEEEIRGLV